MIEEKGRSCERCDLNPCSIGMWEICTQATDGKPFKCFQHLEVGK